MVASNITWHFNCKDQTFPKASSTQESKCIWKPHIQWIYKTVLGFNLVNHLNNGFKVNLSKTVCPKEKMQLFHRTVWTRGMAFFFPPDILCILSFQIFSSFGIILLFFPTALAYIFYFAIQHSLNTWCESKSWVKSTQKCISAFGLIIVFSADFSAVSLLILFYCLDQSITFTSSVKWNLENSWTTTSNILLNIVFQ